MGAVKGTKTDDDQECETCPDCVAREMGASQHNYYGPVTEAAHKGCAYQHFVCPWHVHVPSANLIEEWNFSGIDFDGLHPVECLLYEAKHGYDEFLETKDWGKGGRPDINPNKPWADDIFERMFDQARRQHTVVASLHPEVRLTWVFSSMETQVFVYQKLLDNGWWIIEPEHRPWNAGGF